MIGNLKRKVNKQRRRRRPHQSRRRKVVKIRPDYKIKKASGDTFHKDSGPQRLGAMEREYYRDFDLASRMTERMGAHRESLGGQYVHHRLTNLEYAKLLTGAVDGYFKRGDIGGMVAQFDKRKSTYEAMQNLRYKVLPQAHLPPEINKMFDVMMEGMTPTQFDRFYDKYKDVVDEMFASSDSKSTELRSYIKGGRVVKYDVNQFEIPAEDKHEIIFSFMESLAEFRGVSIEEVEKRAGIR